MIIFVCVVFIAIVITGLLLASPRPRPQDGRRCPECRWFQRRTEHGIMIDTEVDYCGRTATRPCGRTMDACDDFERRDGK